MSTFPLNNIFSTDPGTFEERCLEVFRFQYSHNAVYRRWCDTLGRDPSNVDMLTLIPFLPITFFKSANVTTTEFEAETVFESSGTTRDNCTRHFVKGLSIYRESFSLAFRQFYGDPSGYCILALLPSYLEKGNSSLVYMVDGLIRLGAHPQSGFYLHDHGSLSQRLHELESAGTKTILIGVTYALLDFAATHPQVLKHTIVMETGGMKGRRREMVRHEVHGILQQQLGVAAVHSEYSMTELMSQSYSKGGGLFHSPPWMRILVRGEDDPLELNEQGRGVINVVDLANIYSCAFIATDDAGIVHPGGGFEVSGRVDHSDMRGCSLLAI